MVAVGGGVGEGTRAHGHMDTGGAVRARTTRAAFFSRDVAHPWVAAPWVAVCPGYLAPGSLAPWCARTSPPLGCDSKARPL